MRLSLFAVLALLMEAPVLGQVFSFECDSFPETTGQGLEYVAVCTPIRWIQDGWLHQSLDVVNCPENPDQDVYFGPIDSLNGVSKFFLEFRVETTGPRSEIAFVGPTSVVIFNFFGLDYTAVVANDLVRLFRAVGLPVILTEVQEGVPHTVRLELDNVGTPTYVWYIDGEVVDQGFAVGPFPAMDSRISWVSRAVMFPNESRWAYLRYGMTPVPQSGDWTSSGTVGEDDLPFFVECLQNSGEGVDAGPGCRWADMDSDTDVDCPDWEAFKLVWDDPTPPDPIAECPGIPTTSTWGATIMALLLLTGGTVVFRHRRAIYACVE